MPVGTQSPEKFAKHIEGLEWPATKEELVENVRANAAPPEIVEAAMRLPGRQFASREDVLVAYENEVSRF